MSDVTVSEQAERNRVQRPLFAAPPDRPDLRIFAGFLNGILICVPFWVAVGVLAWWLW